MKCFFINIYFNNNYYKNSSGLKKCKLCYFSPISLSKVKVYMTLLWDHTVSRI